MEPVLPPEPHLRLSPAVLVPWMGAGAVSAAAVGLLAAILAPVLDRVDGMPPAVRILLVAGAAAYALLAIVVAPVLRLRNWRYAVREEELDYRHGALVRTRTIVPLERVQHVDTRQSALTRLLGIAELNVHTAAGRHAVPGLREDVAAALRTEIAGRARVPDVV